ncbi:hypothetical protein E4U52_006763 [Claviceps spartinae]|nr:hypothetical protein E4U52_006763 [Claviceps spartinae]
MATSTIDDEVHSQLPDNSDVNAELQTEDVNAVHLEGLIAEIENDAPRHEELKLPWRHGQVVVHSRQILGEADDVTAVTALRTLSQRL